MNRNKTARQHNFATVPRADIPRSKFPMRQTRKQAFDASELIPIYCEEVLPGDTWTHHEAILARLATPIAPLVDDLDLETFYYFVPNRTTWRGNTQDNRWEQFITGQDDTYTIPTVYPFKEGTPNTNELLPGSVLDHFGLLPQNYTDAVQTFSALPIWAYFKIWNEWFRDQNLQEEWTWSMTWTSSGTNAITLKTTTATHWDQMPLRVNKRHDYFTSSLPWPQKGDAVSIPLGTTAPVLPETTTTSPTFESSGGSIRTLNTQAGSQNVGWSGALPGASAVTYWEDPGLYADLSAATAATINSLRLAFQTQKLLERDARGGSRYTEQLLAHFGVNSPAGPLQRSEYLGGSKIPITVNPVAQTASYDAEPADEASAVGNLGAEMHARGSKRTFHYAATEHGYIIGVAVVRSTPTYQQGTRRHWLRQTRLDYYFPAFAMLGEQAVETKEIYQPADGTSVVETWGYQERWAEYRYTPNEITGQLRSTYTAPMDWWHLSEEFVSEPVLNDAFIRDKTQETLARCLATAPSEQWSAQIIMDITHNAEVARLMPTYSVPGLIDHF